MNLKLTLCFAAILSLSITARAGGQKPGSLLVYPKYDNRSGSVTVLTVTNTHTQQDVRAHFIYVNGEDCQESNAFETLTPSDTVSLITAAHSPDPGRGYVYVYARSATGAGAVTFNHLAGSSVILDGMARAVYAMQPVVFEGMTKEGAPTDLDSDGNRDLDGLEYTQAPGKTVIPRFFGQGGGGVASLYSELVLVNLTGGRAFTTNINFLVYNDNEEAFSGEHGFYCWDNIPLTSLSGAVLQSFLKNATNEDPDEIIGFPNLEAGWISFDGGTANSSAASISDPAVLVSLIDLGRLASSQLPFVVGEQSNGSLLPTSIFGN